jgi:hypothetical protein
LQAIGHELSEFSRGTDADCRTTRVEDPHGPGASRASPRGSI